MVWVKRLGVALLALLLLVGAGVAALVAFVDPNDYKPMLQQTVQERYNRTLVIDGDIRLSLLPRLGLEISGVSLSEPGSTQTFAAMDTARVAVAWWPLLSRHLVIDHVTVTGLKANLVRNDSGRFNFHDFLAAAPNAVANQVTPVPARPAGDGPALAWNIAGVSIEGGEVAITDAASGTALRIERLAAQARGIAVGQPFDLSLAGRVLGQSPRADAALQAQARITLPPAGQQLQVAGLDLRLEGVLPSVKANLLQLKGSVVANLAQATLQAENLALVLQGDVASAPPLQGLDLQVAVPGLQYAWDAGTMVLQQASLKAQGRLDGQAVQASLEAPALQWGTGQPSQPVQLRLQRSGPQALLLQGVVEGLQGDANGAQASQVVVQGQAVLPEARQMRWQFQGQPRWQVPSQTLTLAAVQGQLQLQGEGLPQAGVVLPATAALVLNLQNSQLTAHGNVGQADQTLAWQLQGQALVTEPRWAVQLTAQAFDQERWWPSASVAAGANDAPAPAAGAGTGAPGAGAAQAETPLWNPDWLAGLNLTLDAQVERLSAQGVAAEQVRLALQVADGRAQIKQLQARLYQGTLQATAAVAADQSVGLQAQLRNVAVQPLLQAVAGTDTLSGRGNLDLSLNSRGVRVSELRQALAGNVTLQVRDGAVRGINVAQTLRDFRNVLGKQDTTQAADLSRQTDFTELRANLAMNQGVATVQELLLAAPLVRITQGDPAQINLVNDTFNLVVQAVVVNTATGQDGKALEQLRGVRIPIHLTGPLNAPQYAILWSGVGGQALQQVLQNEVERQLGRLLERQPDEAAPATDSSSPSRALGDALKGLLGR